MGINLVSQIAKTSKIQPKINHSTPPAKTRYLTHTELNKDQQRD